jgi:putative DNA primase/helicase
MVLTAPKVHLQSAIHLLNLGYSVVPSGSGPKGKYPLVKWKEFQKRLPTEAELERWQDSLYPRLWGVITGEVSGIVVIDTDDTKARSILEKTGLTPHILTPRCANFWFRHPRHFVKTEAGILPNLDIRGDKGFVNVVGTRRDGGIYRIFKWPTPENIYPWECLPTAVMEAIKKPEKLELQPLFTRVDRQPVHQPVGEHAHLADLLLQRSIASAVDGTRNQTGLWLCCQLRDNGFAYSEAESVILEYARTVLSLDPSDPYTADEAIRSLKQSYSRFPREPWSINIRTRCYQYDKV